MPGPGSILISEYYHESQLAIKPEFPLTTECEAVKQQAQGEPENTDVDEYPEV
jgi:hypothetical protein